MGGSGWRYGRPELVSRPGGVLTLVYGPGFLAGALGPANVTSPVFPSTIARYSWYTGMLSSDRFAAATLLYQNGVGVEFMDTPQSVLLSADESKYRRLDEAESLSIPEDQGDPAVSVLLLDGTFVVTGSAGRTGEVYVVNLRDGHTRTITVGTRRTALPFSIGADGRSALLATSDDVVESLWRATSRARSARYRHRSAPRLPRGDEPARCRVVARWEPNRDDQRSERGTDRRGHGPRHRHLRDPVRGEP